MTRLVGVLPIEEEKEYRRMIYRLSYAELEILMTLEKADFFRRRSWLHNTGVGHRAGVGEAIRRDPQIRALVRKREMIHERMAELMVTMRFNAKVGRG